MIYEGSLMFIKLKFGGLIQHPNSLDVMIVLDFWL